jgi:hypothetical protein
MSPYGTNVQFFVWLLPANKFQLHPSEKISSRPMEHNFTSAPLGTRTKIQLEMSDLLTLQLAGQNPEHASLFPSLNFNRL